MIKLSHVAKSFDDGKTFTVKDISFQIESGETVVLLGSSGCGKTTTLKMMNGLVKPTSGSIEIDGQEINTFDPVKLRRSIGYVFQGIGLFPHMSIEDNISIVLRLNKKSQAERRARARELMQMVKLDPEIFAQRFPAQLSGGQQQRVGVARALADDPNILLMDEPFAALDTINRDILQAELVELKQGLQKTIVFVTHDIFEAIRMGDRIAVMNQGRIEQMGTAKEVIQHPASQFVHDLFHTAAIPLYLFDMKAPEALRES
jgi:osmoprotectant transport system ATP-binding protein